MAKANNGREAFEQLETFHPDIIILDVMMPGQTGFEVAKQIRSNPAFETTRIIFLTAKGTSEDKLNGYANGGEVYLTKPFENDELVQVVSEMMEYRV